MRLLPFAMPEGWPVSLWFFVATALVYLLQRFPYTGIFLMILMAAFWSVILINLGMIGIGVEAVTGRVSWLWLFIPLLYFGAYYFVWYQERGKLAALRGEFARQNEGKSLPFDPEHQDLIVGEEGQSGEIAPFGFVRDFGVKRVYDANGRVHFMGNSEACAIVRNNAVLRSAGVYSFGFQSGSTGSRRRGASGYCSISAPGTPERPVVRVTGKTENEKRGTLPIQITRIRLSDETSRASTELISARASPLPPFPMPVMGCALNSGAASWDCFAGFFRTRPVAIAPAGTSYEGNLWLAARGLGLQRNEDYAAVATAPDWLLKVGEEADRKLVAEELGKLEQMLADPEARIKDGWFRHLPNRPEIVVPYADRIFAVLAKLHASTSRTGAGNETGGELWRLAATLPDEVLAPHREEMIAWLSPDTAKEFSKSADQIYTRLDASEPRQREILLRRLEDDPRADLRSSLLPQFCRMGDAAPDDVKQRLLAVWEARGRRAAERKSHRAGNETILYATLLRMGLKQQVGKVEQRYYGPTFEAIWNEVTPNSPPDLCDGNLNDFTNRFRWR